ncbi:MAG TPA: hypothetical protein VE981_23660 [Planctomycetota bacterium]|nr:hypothetical protein [Planctomycetota bacterium]
MNAVLIMALLCQDADLSVTGKAKRQDKEYELTVAGKGRALNDQEIVSLHFRRLGNRVHWPDGMLVTEPIDEEIGRVAHVENQSFTHAEKFATAGEVEVRIGVANPEGGPSEPRQIRRVFRTASLPEEAHALVTDAKEFDAALRGVRRILDDVDTMKAEPMPPVKKQGRLQKRIDWRKNAYRQQVADSSLTASARALALWMDDVENATELEQSGKDAAGMISALSGTPFSWADARNRLLTLEAVSLRERALLIVREIEELAREITSAGSSGDGHRWARLEKELSRTLEMLKEADHGFREGIAGGHYASLVDLPQGTVADLIQETADLFQAAASCIHCTPSADADLADLGRKLMDRAAAFEVRIRTHP